MPAYIDPPNATGIAAQTVARRAAPQDLIFHAGWFCPFAGRVWVALEEKGIPYQYKEQNPYDKDPEFLKLNPKGLIPALQHDGRGLYESNILLEYLEDAFPSAPALRPRDPHEAALARLALQFISTTVVPAFFRLMQAQGQEKQDEAKESFVQVLKELYNQWFDKQTGAQWARNDTFGWIEAALAPFLARFPLLAAHRAFSIEMVGPDFSSWAERVLDRPSVRAVLSAPEAYHTIYGRYFNDTAKSQVAQATRSAA
ncbi:glutathione S-transferase family protein [Rhodotorula paludigena]|uniref:glutathione S-transferase family protein n=1 Tax=Rhodotorula paludigena TaxID=86838 RepID=UPI00316C3A39